jgi:hypothetical protein
MHTCIHTHTNTTHIYTQNDAQINIPLLQLKLHHNPPLRKQAADACLHLASLLASKPRPATQQETHRTTDTKHAPPSRHESSHKYVETVLVTKSHAHHKLAFDLGSPQQPQAEDVHHVSKAVQKSFKIAEYSANRASSEPAELLHTERTASKSRGNRSTSPRRRGPWREFDHRLAGVSGPAYVGDLTVRVEYADNLPRWCFVEFRDLDAV